MIYLTFIALAVVIVFAANRLSTNAIIIERNSKISAVIVGIILAFATSLPELATGITSSVIGQSEMSISNVLGSNTFNVMILAIMNVIFFKHVVYSKVSKNTNRINYFVMLMYIVTLISVLSIGTNLQDTFALGRISIATIIIAVVYYISLKVLDIEEEGEDNSASHDASKLKSAVIQFVIFAIVVLVASISLSVVADRIVEISGLSASYVGAIFIGITTSLPELTSAFTLTQARKYDLAASSVLGSNLFNFTILFVVDVVSKNPLLSTDFGNSGTLVLIYMGMFFTFVTMFAIEFGNKNKFINLIVPVIIILTYVGFVLLGSAA